LVHFALHWHHAQQTLTHPSPPGEGSGNNYAYLVVDDKTKDATIVDPANPPESVTPGVVYSPFVCLSPFLTTHAHTHTESSRC